MTDVSNVFTDVSSKYDLMNDLMSFGLHRAWKSFTANIAYVKEGWRVLDVAGGSGDLCIFWKRLVGETGEVWLSDFNPEMIRIGRDKLIEKNLDCKTVICDASALPFTESYFDLVSVAFGLRNFPDKTKPLREMLRVLRPGGQLLVLEFSKIYPIFQKPYEVFLDLIPKIGLLVAKNEDAYRYLVNSIKSHPDQSKLTNIIKDAGFDRVDFFNLSAGICALHRGFKF